MSFDNVGWFNENVKHYKARLGKGKRDVYGQPIGWAAAPDALNRFQSKVIDIVGRCSGNIYNSPVAWDTFRWDYGGGIGVPWKGGELTTFDFGRLTRFVLLCHVARIRFGVQSHGRNLLLTFYQRSHEGGMSDRHPGLDEAVEKFDEELEPEFADGRAPLVHYDPALDDPLPERRKAQMGWLLGRRIPTLLDELEDYKSSGLDDAVRSRETAVREAFKDLDEVKAEVAKRHELPETELVIARLRGRLEAILAVAPPEVKG